MPTRAQPLLGTYVEIRADADDDAVAEAAIGDAFAAIARVHAAMSVHDEHSELSRLNAGAHRRAQRVSGALWRVLRAARRLHGLSEGAFDVAVGSDLQREGFLPRRGRASARGGSSGDIEFPARGWVRYARPLTLDLGGIAKGYAVDRAIAALRRGGARGGVVNAGGDLRVFGAQAQVIHVRDPREPARLVARGELHDGAIATSGGYFSRDATDGRTPLVDPRTHEACIEAPEVSVIARTCLVADAMTKVVALRGERARPLLRRLGARTLAP